jgi:hypothetical protein
MSGLLLAAGWAGVQLGTLGLDPAAPLVDDVGVFVDEGLKTLRARNHAVFGVPVPVAGDSYAGGTGGPLATSLQRLAFAGLGPRAESARILSVVAGLVTLGGVAALSPPGGRVIAMVFVGASPLFLGGTRTGLLEAPWTALAVLAAAVTAASPGRAALGGAVLGAACLVKPMSLLAGPAVVVAALTATPGTVRRRVQAALWVSAGFGLALLLGRLMADDVTGQAEHALHAARASLSHLVEAPSVAIGALRQLLTDDPVLYVTGLAGVLSVLAAWRGAGGPQRRAAAVALAWLSGGLIALVLYGIAPPPARLVFSLVVPLGLGTGLAAAWLRVRLPRSAPVLLAATLAMTVPWAALRGGFGEARTLMQARRHVADLAGATTPPVLVTGLWAPTLTLGSRAPALVTCVGCRFPAPQGAVDNAVVALAHVQAGPRGGIIVVAEVSSGELEGWRRLLRGAGLDATPTGWLAVGRYRLAVLRPRPRPDRGALQSARSRMSLAEPARRRPPPRPS